MDVPFTLRSLARQNARPRCPTRSARTTRPNRSKDGVAVVDVVTERTVKVLKAGLDPETFDVSPDGTRLFVSNEDADSLTIVDLSTGKARVDFGRELPEFRRPRLG